MALIPCLRRLSDRFRLDFRPFLGKADFCLQGDFRRLNPISDVWFQIQTSGLEIQTSGIGPWKMRKGREEFQTSENPSRHLVSGSDVWLVFRRLVSCSDVWKVFEIFSEPKSRRLVEKSKRLK